MTVIRRRPLWVRFVGIFVTICFFFMQLGVGRLGAQEIPLPYQITSPDNVNLPLEEAVSSLKVINDTLHYFQTIEDFQENFSTNEGIDQSLVDKLTEIQNVPSITAAAIHLTDGNIQILENGQTQRIIKADGTVVTYQDNLIKTITSPKNPTQVFSYQKNSYGHITKITITEGNTKKEYSPDGKIEKSYIPTE
ncbi:MAG: hypothetical protein KKF54_00045 [Candidatus Omnitrophica bacterium]|nr:hypothetical protein [Candidatus Omnitrophota bacterium]